MITQELLHQAIYYVAQDAVASTNQLMRQFALNLGDANRLLDEMHHLGVLGETVGVEARSVLVTRGQVPAIIIADALRRDGFDPPPHAGQVWRDITATWPPAGTSRLVRIASIGKTVTGWQCRVESTVADANGVVLEGPNEGILPLTVLIEGYELVGFAPANTGSVTP